MKYLQIPMLAAGLFMAASAWAAQTVDIEIDAGRPGPVISKNLYGQAAGQAGAMWVGPGSKIPNIKGWRKDMVAALKALHVPVLRWPAGCAADEYNWRDGIGARDKDAGAVGTHEFFDLVELLGADAYVNGNVGTGSAREAAEWVEYMVAREGSTLANLRAKNGRSQPFKLAFFGIGHAPWSCGGNMTPQYYADLYNQFAVFIRGKGGKGADAPKLVSSGGGAEWTDELSTRKRIRDYRDGISAHPAPALNINEFIDSNIAMLDKNDAAKKIPLVIGEWDARDALAASLHFHAFHAHAGRVSMATFAQAAMIQAIAGKMVLSPAYHAFKMHVPFQEARALPLRLDSNPQYKSHSVGTPTVSASAARARDGKLYLSLVNSNPQEAVAIAVAVTGAVAKAASGAVLTAGAVDAPAPLVAHADQGRLRLTLKARSVTVLAIDE